MSTELSQKKSRFTSTAARLLAWGALGALLGCTPASSDSSNDTPPPSPARTGGKSGSTGGATGSSSTGGNTAAGGSTSTGGSVGSGGSDSSSSGGTTGSSGGAGGNSDSGGSAGNSSGGGSGSGGSSTDASTRSDGSGSLDSKPASDDGGTHKVDPASPIVACKTVRPYHLDPAKPATAEDFCAFYAMFCPFDPTGKMSSGSTPAPAFYKDFDDCVASYTKAGPNGKSCRAGQLCSLKDRKLGQPGNPCTHASGHHDDCDQ
jgi:hypothetical protein